MKVQNIFFVICALVMFMPEMCAMLLVAKQVPRAVYRVNSMGQRRNETTGQIIAEGLMAFPVVYVMGIIYFSALYEGSYRAYNAIQYVKNQKAFTTKTLYNQVAAIGSEQCSVVYIRKEQCQNKVCCKNVCLEKKVEIFNGIDHKLYFSLALKNGLQKLCSKEEEIRGLLAQNKIDAQGYQKIIGLIEHKKDCYDKQIAFFDQLEKNKE